MIVTKKSLSRYSLEVSLPVAEVIERLCRVRNEGHRCFHLAFVLDPPVLEINRTTNLPVGGTAKNLRADFRIQLLNIFEESLVHQFFERGLETSEPAQQRIAVPARKARRTETLHAIARTVVSHKGEFPAEVPA